MLQCIAHQETKAMDQQQQHFLVATYRLRSHIIPAVHLAKRLASATPAAITVSTPISAHRYMFPSSDLDQELHDGDITYIPFSDGYDNGIGDTPFSEFLSNFNLHGSRNLNTIIRRQAAAGRPVTCVIYTIMLPWAAGVAHELGIPSALYWIQASTVFSIYNHYSHDHGSLIAAYANDPFFTVNLPGLPSLQIRELPSFFTMAADHPFFATTKTLWELFDSLERHKAEHKPRVLVNSFDALEADALPAVDQAELIPIGPLLPFLFGDDKELFSDGKDLGDGGDYMEWLDQKAEGTVVYVSFGSYSVLKKKQMEELLQGLKESKRPYLWVVNKDNRGERIELEEEGEEGQEGMMVEWCSQMKVLRHPAVGCIVTHCGWNSTLESIVCGVPMVCVPQWTDQVTNAKLVEAVWGNGIRSKVNEEGVLEREELKRCLEMVMGEEEGVEIRSRAKMWAGKALEAAMEGGSSDRNLKKFLNDIKN